MASLFRRKLVISKPFQSLITDATADLTVQPDWGQFMEISDQVATFAREDPAKLHDTIKLIRRRMSSKQWRSVLMCLFLVETLVKNCSVVVHRSIGTEKFMKAVMAVVSATKGKINADAREVHTKALELIQAWGEAFLPKQRDPGLRWFVIAYQQLRQKGVKFPRPQMDTTAAPIFTPPPHIPEDTEPEHKAAAANSTGIENLVIPEPSEALPGQLAVLHNVLQVIAAMLLSSESRSSVRNNEVLAEMVAQCRKAEPRLAELIATVMSTDVSKVAVLLELNDALQAVLAEYEYMKAHGPRPKKAAPAPAPAAAPAAAPAPAPAPSPAPAPAPAPNNDLLDIFGTAPAAPAVTPAPAAAAAAPAAALSAPVQAEADAGDLNPTTRFRVLAPPRSPGSTSTAAAVPALAPPRSAPRTGRRRSRTNSASSAASGSLDLFGPSGAATPAAPTAPAARSTPAAAVPSFDTHATTGAVAASGAAAAAAAPAKGNMADIFKTGNPYQSPPPPSAAAFNPFATDGANPTAAPGAPAAPVTPAPAAAAAAAASFNPFDSLPAAPTPAAAVAAAYATSPAATAAPATAFNPFGPPSAAGSNPVAPPPPAAAAATTAFTSAPTGAAHYSGNPTAVVPPAMHSVAPPPLPSAAVGAAPAAPFNPFDALALAPPAAPGPTPAPAPAPTPAPAPGTDVDPFAMFQ